MRNTRLDRREIVNPAVRTVRPFAFFRRLAYKPAHALTPLEAARNPAA